MAIKLPTKISVLSGPVRPLQGLPSTSPPSSQIGVQSSKSPSLLSQAKNSPSPLHFPKPTAVSQPNDRTTEEPTNRERVEELSPKEATPLVRMEPVLTSTPKAKRTIFPGADGSDSIPTIEAEDVPRVKPEAVAPVETARAESTYSTETSSAAAMATTSTGNVTSRTSPKTAISPPAVQQQHLPLQKSRVSWKLSSPRRESDSESISSSTGSEESLDNEGRDTFDPGKQFLVLLSKISIECIAFCKVFHSLCSNFISVWREQIFHTFSYV